MKALDAANFLIDICAKSDEHDFMTNLRLQKFLFFAQGWHLALHGTPLFEEVIEAWKYGPVVPDVYIALRSNWKNPIRHVVKGYKPGSVSDDDSQFLIDVLNHYNECTTRALVSQTHQLKSWRNSSKFCEEIKLDDILADFASLDHRLVTFDEIVQRLPIAKGLPRDEDFDDE